MNHDLNTRMSHIRMCLSDPRLTNRQQKVLAAIATFMPFDIDDGWVLKTRDLSKAVFFAKEPSQSHLRTVRRVLKELEDSGFIMRVYASSRMNMHEDATYFMNWQHLLEPYREALREARSEGQGDPRARVKVTRPSLYVVPSSTQGPSGETETNRKATR